jgi:hypothetical protein
VIAVNPMVDTLRKQSEQSTPRIALIDEKCSGSYGATRVAHIRFDERPLWGVEPTFAETRLNRDVAP